MIACRDARSINLSTNRGGTGSNTAVYWGSVADSRTAFVAPVAYCKSNPSILYAATDNIHKSTNGGGSWTNNAYSTATQYIEAQHKTGIALAVSPTNSNKVYVSTSPFAQYDNDVDNIYVTGAPNILKTTTGSTPFSSIKGNLPDRYVMDFAISETDDDSVFIVLGGFDTSHVYVTGNGGNSWTAISTGLPNIPFNAILIDPVNPQIIYAGCDLGVYVSPNRGATWYDFNNGFWDATLVIDLQATADNQIVAATHGKGIFISPRFTSTLPVDITSFTGLYENGSNKLKWITENESNLKQYELEKSVDGSSFTKIATIATLNQNSTETYQYNDAVDKFKTATYRYRVRSVDRDGSYRFSKVIALNVTSQRIYHVINNPFKDVINVNLNLTENQIVIFRLSEINGHLVKKETFNLNAGFNSIDIINVETLAKGIYILEATLNRKRFTTKLIKN